MMNNNDTFHWDCIKGTRAIKDEISAELNAMTSEERHLYFKEINQKAHDFLRDLKR